MDSVENGATIRIGFRRYYKENSHIVDFRRPTYSIKINKKTFLNVDSGDSTKDYLETYKSAAEEIAGVMKENYIKNSEVINGERVRFSNHKWTSCEAIPNDGEELFNKTLEDCLK